MSWTIVGLGNPGEKYDKTRHNIGRDIVNSFNAEKNIRLVTPDTYMNDSGLEVKKFIKNKKQAETMIVVYDDLDIPLGKMKISFNKSSGGHKGVQSIIDHIKTQEFIRLRIGIAPVTPSGKVKKVLGEDAVIKHVLSKFKTSESKSLKKVMENGVKALDLIIERGYERAANDVNGW